MEIDKLKRIYFIGIGGIGMSALARFFRQRGATVGGYDRAETALTWKLAAEGISLHYEDAVNTLDQEADLVVYTPAVPDTNEVLSWYRAHQYPVYKRSDVLQWITEKLFAITVAGTHGKTTISTMIAHLLRETGYGCNAFLGGISVNYDTNYWGSDRAVAVIEADEYDRSFLKLYPDIAVLTAMDADHLDIYGTKDSLEAAFNQYTQNIKANGTLWYKHGLPTGGFSKDILKRSYSLQNDAAEVYAQNVQIKDGGYCFDVQGKDWRIDQVLLNIGGMHNVENCIAALAVAMQSGIDPEALKKAVAGFKGVKRRFEFIIKNEHTVYIDDYAHHPEELAALIKSAKSLFPDRKCVLAFQPHLYSRTRDLAEDFAHSLDMADQILLLDIYPAREQPIAGVGPELITSKMGNPNHTILSKEGLVQYVRSAKPELFITAGAGDIDQLIQRIAAALMTK